MNEVKRYKVLKVKIKLLKHIVLNQDVSV